MRWRGLAVGVGIFLLGWAGWCASFSSEAHEENTVPYKVDAQGNILRRCEPDWDKPQDCTFYDTRSVKVLMFRNPALTKDQAVRRYLLASEVELAAFLALCEQHGWSATQCLDKIVEKLP